jgi:hypothetical protein
MPRSARLRQAARSPNTARALHPLPTLVRLVTGSIFPIVFSPLVSPRYIAQMPEPTDSIDARLAALEAEWQQERARYLTRDKDGQLREATGGPNIPRVIALIVGSVVVMALLAASPLPSFLGFLGLIPFAFGTFQLMVGSSKAEAYERGQTAYESRKAALERERAAVGGAPGSGTPDTAA